MRMRMAGSRRRPARATQFIAAHGWEYPHALPPLNEAKAFKVWDPGKNIDLTRRSMRH